MEKIAEELLTLFRKDSYIFKVIYSSHKVDLRRNLVYREARIAFRFSDSPDTESYRQYYPENVRKSVPEKWYTTDTLDLREPWYLYSEDIKQTLCLAEENYIEWLKNLKLSTT